MKTLVVSLMLALTMPVIAYGQDKIIGKWQTADKKGVIEIFKQGDKYAGKIAWLKEPTDAETGKPKLDKLNPNKSMRANPIIGLVILNNFTYNEADHEYKGGIIYDPKKGETYKSKMWLEDNNTLNLRGYLLFLYRTEKWTRVP